MANSGHFADSEGDQGDVEAEEDESLGGDERCVTVNPFVNAVLAFASVVKVMFRFAAAAALSSFKRAPPWEAEFSTRGTARRRGRGREVELVRRSQRTREIAGWELWTRGT